MIKTRKLIPNIYYDKSRDFQVLGKTYDIIFNYLKTNTDLLRENSLEILEDKTLTNLLASTLGFKVKHFYDNEQLAAICSIFLECLKNKGNLRSIKLVLNLLNHIERCDEECVVTRDAENPTLLNIYIPPKITDITLFEDILDYILPASLSYHIRKDQKISSAVSLNLDVIENNDDIKATMISNLDLSKIYASKPDLNDEYRSKRYIYGDNIITPPSAVNNKNLNKEEEEE